MVVLGWMWLGMQNEMELCVAKAEIIAFPHGIMTLRRAKKKQKMYKSATEAAITTTKNMCQSSSSSLSLSVYHNLCIIVYKPSGVIICAADR